MTDMGDTPVDSGVGDPMVGPDTVHRRNSSALIAAVVGVVALGLVLVLAVSSGGGGSKRRNPIIGTVAPPLSGVDLTGRAVGLDSFKGDWVLVNFFASWCPPCIQEHPELIRLSKDDGGPLQIISIGFQDSVKNVRKFFDENGGNWPVLAGDTGSVGLQYGVVKLPESFLVSPFGRVVAKFEGGVTAELVQSYITRSDLIDGDDADSEGGAEGGGRSNGGSGS